MVRLVNAGDEPGDEAASSSERRDLVRRLAEEVEPSSTIVSATARDDPALALVADPEAARSASDAAAAAAERLRRLSSIVQSLSEEEWRPPRRPRDVEVSEGPSWSVKDSAPAEIGRRPLIVELDDDDDGSTAATDPSTDDATTPSNSNDVDVLSLGTVAALTAAAYCRGAELHGAGGLPGWSTPEAEEAARALLRDSFGAGGVGGEGPAQKDLDDAARELLARCLGEAAPVLAHCLALEPEPRWRDEVDASDERAPRPEPPQLPTALTRSLQAASGETALVAATRLRWLIEAAGYPWLGRSEGVVSRMVPCVLRAVDHRNSAVRREGCAALVALVSATTRSELRWHDAAILDAAAQALSGSAPEVFGAAAAAYARTAIAVSSNDFRDPILASAFLAMINAANSRAHEPPVAAAWVVEAPRLISAVKLAAGAHLNRLLPPLLQWLHARDDSTAAGAAACLELTCKMTWPLIPNHGETLWPDIARAYAEADARDATSDFRRALERLAATVQLAAGDSFEAAWRAAAKSPPPPELKPLTTYLERLPKRVVTTEWEDP